MDMINATTPSTGFSQEIIPIQLIARESSAGQMKTKGKKK
jgi:hypothetical protein